MTQDVSNNALSIARMIDRLGPGRYEILLIRPKSTTERWTVEFTQNILGTPVTIRRELDRNTTWSGAVSPNGYSVSDTDVVSGMVPPPPAAEGDDE